MPDKTINHFVLADGSVARYSAEHLAGDVPEVVGIRTGYDGTVYESAGDAVRGQATELNNTITDNLGGLTKNLYNANADTRGFVINASGDIVSNVNYKISDFIKIGPNTTFTFAPTFGDGTGVMYVVYYDEDKNFVARQSLVPPADSFTFTTNSQRYYIRFNIYTRTPAFMCNLGDTLLPYEPYGFEYCDYLKQVQANKENIENLFSYTLTDPYKLPFVYGYRNALTTRKNSFGALTMAKPLHIKAGSTITRVSNVVKIQVCYKADTSDTWSFVGFNDNQLFTMSDDGIVLIGIKWADDSNILNNQILDNLSINLKSDTEFPILFDERPYSIFNTVPYDMYIGKHTDNTGFNEQTSYSDIIAAFDTLVDNLYITKADLGVSSDGVNHVYSYTCAPQGKYPLDKSSTKATRTYPTIILIGSIHGYEKTATYGLYYLLKDLVDNNIQDPALMYLRSNVRIVMVPACVPYGWENGSRYNANGINIDRNFGTNGWSAYSPDDSDPWEYNAKGSAPYSEIETQILMNLIATEKATNKALFVMDIHTNGVDTSTPDQICVADPSTLCEMNEYSARTYDSALSFVSTLKPFIDKLYNVNINNRTYGYCALSGDFPALYNWSQEQSDLIGVLLEVLAGSRSTYLGSDLTTYSPDTLKLAGEQIANFALKILAELCK